MEALKRPSEGFRSEFRFDLLPPAAKILIYSHFSSKDAHCAIGSSKSVSAFIGLANSYIVLVTSDNQIAGPKISRLKRVVIEHENHAQILDRRISKISCCRPQMNQIERITFRFGMALLIPALACGVIGGYFDANERDKSKLLLSSIVLGSIAISLLFIGFCLSHRIAKINRETSFLQSRRESLSRLVSEAQGYIESHSNLV